MRILLDAISDNDFIRGPDRYVLGLLQGLAEIDAENRFVVAYAPWQKFFEEISLPENFEHVRLEPPRERVLRVAWHATAFPRIAARLAPDLVHLTNIILAPGTGRPVVMTVHDLAHFRFPEKFGAVRGRLQRFLIRSALTVPDRVIAVSQFSAGDIGKFTSYPHDRVRVVYEGAPKLAPAEPFRHSRPYFLYVGQLERSKNIEQLIDEFAESAALADADLLIAGKPGTAASRVKARIAATAPDRIRHLGYVSEATLASLYAGCVGFVFPSLVEGFGLVLAEAMAAGAPVVAMRTSAIPEVVGDAALLVDPDEHGGLRRAMERLQADPALRRELIERGRKQSARLSWPETARCTLEVYREAVR